MRLLRFFGPEENSRNPFQGGMGFFTGDPIYYKVQDTGGRNPFQGGMGFFTTEIFPVSSPKVAVVSQSLSGWDGVFHKLGRLFKPSFGSSRNPFQGGMGFFTGIIGVERRGEDEVAIPFRVGWGFSPAKSFANSRSVLASQSLSGWDGVFHQEWCLAQAKK